MSLPQFFSPYIISANKKVYNTLRYYTFYIISITFSKYGQKKMESYEKMFNKN